MDSDGAARSGRLLRCESGEGPVRQVWWTWQPDRAPGLDALTRKQLDDQRDARMRVAIGVLTWVDPRLPDAMRLDPAEALGMLAEVYRGDAALVVRLLHQRQQAWRAAQIAHVQQAERRRQLGALAR